MPCGGRNFMRIMKVLITGVTIVCISWTACVNNWHGAARWNNRRVTAARSFSTMRTIVAYSEGKQAEMDRPSPVTCERFPASPEVPHFNLSWSPGIAHASVWQQVAGAKVSLYAAYYDERSTQHYVRILAMFNGRNFSSEDTLFCQTRPLNTEEDFVEVVAAKPAEIWWHEWDTTSKGIETPLLLSCPLTGPLYHRSVVSIVTQPCEDPTNAFTLEPTQDRFEYKRNFTICVKDMKFDRDISRDLIEWIETNKLLGAEMIDIYIDVINKANERVLLHYKDQGYIRLFHVPIKHRQDRALWQRRRDHIITYNDCLYRNIRESEFIIPLDVDEIVLPKIANTWSELLDRLGELGWDPTQYSAVLVRNVFFFDFMQNKKYKNKNAYSNINKMYTKRDDVRISKSDTLDIQSNDNFRNINQVIDNNKIEIFNEKTKCGRKLELPKLSTNIVRSVIVSPVGFYSKSFMLTKKVFTAFNHYPLASLGGSGFSGWSAPFSEVQLNHYKESCNTTMMAECGRYGQRTRVDPAALHLGRRLAPILLSTICTLIK